MKKIVLSLVFLMGLGVSGVFADTVSNPIILQGGAVWAGTYGYITNVSYGIYSCCYDETAKSMVISVQYMKSSAASDSNTITIKENSNPKLYLAIKEAIMKHLDSYLATAQMTTAPRYSLYNFYGVISFSYNSSNCITGFRFNRGYNG